MFLRVQIGHKLVSSTPSFLNMGHLLFTRGRREKPLSVSFHDLLSQKLQPLEPTRFQSLWKRVLMKYLCCFCTSALIPSCRRKQINLRHQPPPVGSSCKGQECGKCFLSQSPAVWAFCFLNLEFLGLRELEINVNNELEAREKQGNVKPGTRK